MSVLFLKLGANLLTETQLEQIRQRLPSHLALVQGNSAEELEPHLPHIEVVAGWFKPATLLEMPKLKWAHFWGTGTDWIQRYPQMAGMDFLLTNVAGHSTVQINEHIFGMLLSLTRNLRNAQAAQQAGVWARTHQPAEAAKFRNSPFSQSSGDLFELADKTMLILGVGGIGERTAKIAKAFGMSVIGTRRNPSKTTQFVDELVGNDRLDELLPRADVIVCALPYTRETEKLIDAKRLALMKRSAIFINVGRGKVVDESALTTALQNKAIAGAALDVFENEPLPADSPLWQLDNVLITAHYAGASPRYHERAIKIFLDNLDNWREGHPMHNIVDKSVGY